MNRFDGFCLLNDDDGAPRGCESSRLKGPLKIHKNLFLFVF